MPSLLKPKSSDDPHDIVVVAPEAARLAPDAARLAPDAARSAPEVRVAPDVVTPAVDEISDLLRAAARHHADTPARAGSPADAPVPSVDTTFRPTAAEGDRVVGRRPARRLAARFFAALLLALFSGAAAIAWETYGNAARQTLAVWAPQLALMLPAQRDAETASPSSAPSAETAAADTTPAQTPAPAADGVAAIGAATSADPAQLARDLANMGQEVEQLKATIAELKANQQQMARDLAKASDQNARAKLVLAPPPHPAIPRPRKPVPAAYSPSYPPTQGAVAPPASTAAAPSPAQAAQLQAAQSQAAQQPYVPRQADPAPSVTQLPPAPGFTSVPRPPMPLQ